MPSRYLRRFVFFVIVQLSSFAQASALQYMMPDYYLGHLVRSVLKVASEVGYSQHDVLNEPSAKAKVQAALQSIYQHPSFNYTYDDVTILVTRGIDGEPNGFSFGNYIFITKSMIDLLTKEQLTAVIAHELAHSEKAHNLQKTPLPLEATIYQIKTIYDSVSSGQWPSGKDLVHSIQEIMGTASLAMELQADCIAAQQLEYMRSQGLPNRATDLNSATSAISGTDVTQLNSDEPTSVRARALVNKDYLNGSCDIFRF